MFRTRRQFKPIEEGNNKTGKAGKRKCGACRSGRRKVNCLGFVLILKCEYGDLNESCLFCTKKGLRCGAHDKVWGTGRLERERQQGNTDNTLTPTEEEQIHEFNSIWPSTNRSQSYQSQLNEALRFPSAQQWLPESGLTSLADEILTSSFVAPHHKPLLTALNFLYNSVKMVTEGLNNAATAINKIIESIADLNDSNDGTEYGQHLSDFVEFIGRFDLKRTWENVNQGVNQFWSKFAKNIKAMASGAQEWTTLPGFGGLL